MSMRLGVVRFTLLRVMVPIAIKPSRVVAQPTVRWLTDMAKRRRASRAEHANRCSGISLHFLSGREGI